MPPLCAGLCDSTAAMLREDSGNSATMNTEWVFPKECAAAISLIEIL